MHQGAELKKNIDATNDLVSNNFDCNSIQTSVNLQDMSKMEVELASFKHE